MKLSQKIEKCELSPIRKFYPYVVEAQKRGIKIHFLNIGQPDIKTPPVYFDAISDFRQEVLEYMPSPGIPELIEAIRNGNNTAMTKFREKYRNIDVLLIDDIQFIIGKESTQEEFFHTFNALHSAKKQIIISSDKPPTDMEILEDRIRSRFEWGLLADISSPDYETRVAILRKKEEMDGYNLDDSIIEYIAKNIKSNIRELEGSLNKIIAYANLEKREVTMELAETVLKDIISPNDKKIITPEYIINAVAEHYDITPEDIIGTKRNSKVVYPRQIAMYLCRELANIPLKSIGQCMGNRDHTTIMHGCDKIEQELQNSQTTQKAIEILKKKLQPGN